MWASLTRDRFPGHPRRGFTIVELLIVIVVIGILAAITIVAFNGVQNKAKASAAQSAVSQANKKILTYAAENADQYPASLAVAGIANTQGLEYSYNNDVSPRTYGVTATNGAFSYYVSNTVTQPTTGGYAGHSAGGVAAITNLAPNPKLAAGVTGWGGRASTGGAPTSGRLTGQTTFDPLISTAYRLTLGGPASTWWRIYVTGIAVTPGQTYTLSSWIRPSVATNTTMIIIWRDGTGSVLFETASASLPHAAGVWQRRSTTGVAPATAASVQVEVNAVNNGTTGATLDATGMLFEQSADLHGYADGDTLGWVWNGTPNDATSTGLPR